MTTKRTPKKTASAKKRTIPSEHPAFMLMFGCRAFPTRPVLRARQRLLYAWERGDSAGVDLAVFQLERMLYLPPQVEWLRKTGLPRPGNLTELKERMAAAGFSPDAIAAGEWYPQGVASIILGKGRLCDRKPAAETPPPPLEKDDVKILEDLARRNGIVVYQEDIGVVGRDRASKRLRYLASIGYVQNPPDKSKRGWLLTAAGMSRLAELPALD